MTGLLASWYNLSPPHTLPIKAVEEAARVMHELRDWLREEGDVRIGGAGFGIKFGSLSDRGPRKD